MYAHPLEPRIARLEGSFDQINQRLAAHEQSTSTRFDHVDSRFDHVDRRFDHVDRRFDQMERRFNWLAGLVVGTWITTILGIVYHH
jgi:tetrahydromethanopterin S-methyltransferase subunit G